MKDNRVNFRAWTALAVATGVFALTGCAATNTTSSKTTDPETTPAPTQTESTPTPPPSPPTQTETTPAPPPSEEHKEEPEQHTETTPAPPPPETTPEPEPKTPESKPPEGEKEGPGSFSHAEDEQFCSEHENKCIPNFRNGHGTVVECSDGEWSHSGGLSGACSDHGGEATKE